MLKKIIESGVTRNDLIQFIETWGDLWDVNLYSIEENILFIKQLL